jgi:pimeloyl-ACP methyl ester carboxylesterase
MAGPMPDRRRGLLSLGVGLAAAGAGAALGLAAERVAVGRTVRPADQPGTGFGTVRGSAISVGTDDGVALHVEVDEPAPPDRAGRAGRADRADRADRGSSSSGPVTVVFSHGFALSLDSWHYQRLALRGAYRLVFWDQRGHGRSQPGAPGTTSIGRLGADLVAVVDAVAPQGPLVLIGHSMGGMTLMSAVRQRPELLDRILGVGLLSTSAGDLAGLDLGLPGFGPVLLRLAPAATRLLSRSPRLVASGRRLGSDLESVLVRRYSFASDVDPALVRFAAQMIASTRVEVLSEYLPALNLHDEREALDLLDGKEGLVMVGDGDLMTPPEHSEVIAERLPHAEHLVLRNAGHLMMMEHPEEVSHHLVDLVERSLQANSRRFRGRRPRVPRRVTPLPRAGSGSDRGSSPTGAA